MQQVTGVMLVNRQVDGRCVELYDCCVGSEENWGYQSGFYMVRYWMIVTETRKVPGEPAAGDIKEGYRYAIFSYRDSIEGSKLDALNRATKAMYRLADSKEDSKKLNYEGEN